VFHQTTRSLADDRSLANHLEGIDAHLDGKHRLRKVLIAKRQVQTVDKHDALKRRRLRSPVFEIRIGDTTYRPFF